MEREKGERNELGEGGGAVTKFIHIVTLTLSRMVFVCVSIMVAC